MFLDLKGSTTHAERLGHPAFCRLIQDCFHDLTDSAIEHQVEIYNYVGDEAILTWTIPDSTRNANCIAIYFHFKQALEKNAGDYQQTYSLHPHRRARPQRPRR